MAVVGELYVNFKADLSNLETGFASAKAQSQSFSAEAGESFSNIGDKAAKAGEEVGGLGDESKKTGEKVSAAGKEGADGISLIADALIAIGAVKAFEKIYDGFRQCIDASVEFESAMAGVAKTTDLADAELASMGDSIKKMSTEIPATTTEIAGVAEAAGQLGISSENILEFTETMTMLGTATNMTADEGATMLAQFANITQMPTDEYSNLGSTIVALGNSTATTESKITEMSQGMAASATNAGISEASILGLAAATASVGIEAEAGSTSWSKFIQEIQSAVETGEDLDQWAAVANMTASEFSQLWGQDAAQAINVWIQGLGSAAQQGESMTAILNNLNITEVREMRMLQSLANSGDLLTNALETGNTAWKENTALQKEAATRYATTESKATMLANKQKNLAATIGDQLNPLYSNLLDIGSDVTDFFQDLFEENELLGPALASVAAGAAVAGGAFLVYTAGAKVAEIAQKALNAAMNANPVFLIITGITTAVTALAAFALSLAKADAETQALTAETESLITEIEDATVAAQSVGTQFEAQAATTDNLVGKLDDLAGKSTLTAAELATMQATAAELNAIYPELGLSIDTAGNSADGFTASLKSTNTELTDADGNVLDIADSLGDMTDEIRKTQEQQAKFKASVTMFEQMGEAQSQLVLHQAKMSASSTKVATALGMEEDAANDLVKQLADMPDFFANLIMFQMGLDEEVRNAVESYDENGKAAGDLEDGLSELEGAIKEATGAEIELSDVVYDAAGNILYVVDAEGKQRNMQGELIETTEELRESYNNNKDALAAAGVTMEDYVAATQGMTEAEVEAYEQNLLLGAQYDAMLEKYGMLGVSRTEYIEQTTGMSEAQLAEYNNMLLQDAQMSTLSARYTEMYEAARESIGNQFDLWERIDEKVTISTKTFLKAQDEQAEHWRNLTENVNTLTGLIESGAVPGLAELAGRIDFTTQEGAAMADMLANASEEKLPELVEQFLETSGEADGAAGALADLGVALEMAGTDATDTATDFGMFADTTTEKTEEAGKGVIEFGDAVEGMADDVAGDLDTLDADVQTTMGNIKGYVEELNDTMPEIQFKVNQYIPLPHFSMSGSFNAKTGSVPSVSVDWYDEGGIFTTPQIIGIAERRPEFVGAAADLEEFINKAVGDVFLNQNLPEAAYNEGDTQINITMPLTVTKALTDSEIKRTARKLTDAVGREMARRKGGYMN